MYQTSPTCKVLPWQLVCNGKGITSNSCTMRLTVTNKFMLYFRVCYVVHYKVMPTGWTY